jgi:hypothetical protein
VENGQLPASAQQLVLHWLSCAVLFSSQNLASSLTHSHTSWLEVAHTNKVHSPSPLPEECDGHCCFVVLQKGAVSWSSCQQQLDAWLAAYDAAYKAEQQLMGEEGTWPNIAAGD